MFKMFGALWSAIASLFTSLEDATVSLDNLVNETLLASDLSLAKKADQYKKERAKLSIKDDEINDLLNNVRNRRNDSN